MGVLMMAGKFSFFSLNKKSDWDRGVSVNVTVSDQGLKLNSSSRYGLERIIGSKELPVIDGLRDFAAGRFSLLYLLDDNANLLVYDVQIRHLDHVFRAGHGLFTAEARIASAGEMLCVADARGEHRLMAFSLANGQMLWSVDTANGQPIDPLALFMDHDRNTFILTNSPELDENLVLLKILDSGKIAAIRTLGIPRSVPDQPGEREGRFCLTVTASGWVYVLNTVSRTLYSFSPEGALPAFTLPEPVEPSFLASDSADVLYITDGRPSEPAEDENRFLFTLDRERNQGTVAGFYGRGDKIVLDEKDRIYIWDREQSTFTILEKSNRILPLSSEGFPRGVYLSTSLDSASTELVWHRLQLDAEIPEDCQVRVSYYASDDRQTVIGDRTRDLDRFIMDQSLPVQEKVKALEPLWSLVVINPGDTLFQGAKGRYLWLKFELTGSEQRSPLLRRARVYYPRMSFLEYLPAVYQEDAGSRDFLERFFSLFGTFHQDMEENIDNAARMFDADLVSGEFLRWLARWLAIGADDSWDEERLRALIRQIPEIYRERGTKQGIEKMLALYLGRRPFIVEHFAVKSFLQAMAGMRDLLIELYGDDPYCFNVLVKQEWLESTQDLLTVQKILREEKPAFTEARLVILQPWIFMDMHTYLGVNTYLSELTTLCLDEGSYIPFGTVLTDVERDNRIEVHTRLDIDAALK
jgi:phage tail-like protein